MQLSKRIGHIPTDLAAADDDDDDDEIKDRICTISMMAK